MKQLKLAGLVLATAATLGLSSCNSQQSSKPANLPEEFIEMHGPAGRMPKENLLFDWVANDTAFVYSILYKDNNRRYTGATYLDKKPLGDVDYTYTSQMNTKGKKAYKLQFDLPVIDDEQFKSFEEHYLKTIYINISDMKNQAEKE